MTWLLAGFALGLIVSEGARWLRARRLRNDPAIVCVTAVFKQCGEVRLSSLKGIKQGDYLRVEPRP